MSTIQQFLREPLLHFIAIGGLFFLIYAGVNNGSEKSDDVILISPGKIEQITARFNGVWNRMPTADELENLIEEEVRLEVYYRDALALGLDKNDAIIRARLRQKMEFLTDTGVYFQEPAISELEMYLATNEQAYRSEPRLAFEQVYLGKSPQEDLVFETLKTLQSEPAMDPSTRGQSTFLPAQLKLSRPDAIDSVFGKGFYSQIAVLAPGKWDGPVISDFGQHLVRTLGDQPGRMPPLEEVRDSVLKDWQAEKARENREQDYAERRSRYKVEIHRSGNVSTIAGSEND